jgi:molybdate transport system permease protein
LLGSELGAFGITLPFTTLGVVVAQVFVAVPFYVRSARAGFQSIPRDVEEAAQLDGATSWQVLRNVSMPAALPAISAGAVLCWSRALSEFGATLLFAGNLEGKTQTMPLAIAVILLLISSLILFVSRLVTSDADGFW